MNKYNIVVAGLGALLFCMGPSQAQAQQFSWTGFYFGVNAGYGWSTNDEKRSTVVLDPLLNEAGTSVGDGTLTFDRGASDSAVGGAQIGYNMQFGPLVVGVEADIQGLQSDRNDIVRGTFTSFDQPAVVESVDVIREGGLNGFGTVRARGGIAFDRILVFGTGGFAAARREGDRLDGYAIGGGVEFDIAYFMPFLGPSAKGFLPVSTLTIEGLFVNLGEDRGPRSGVLGGLPSGELPGSAIRLRRSESDFGIARAKINLLF